MRVICTKKVSENTVLCLCTVGQHHYINSKAYSNLSMYQEQSKTICFQTISRPIRRAVIFSLEILEHARYTLERFPTDNARVICTKKGIGKYGIMY